MNLRQLAVRRLSIYQVQKVSVQTEVTSGVRIDGHVSQISDFVGGGQRSAYFGFAL